MKPLSFSFRFVRSVLVILTLAALGLAAVCAQAGSPHIVIAEIYGGGGNTGAPYKYDYIVLYNRSSAELSINGWSVQYASQAGSTWSVTPINGSIPAGGYYLVQEGSGGSVGANLPTPVNATGSINMSATVGKVALVNSTTALSGACPTGGNSIDFVGFGSGTACYEGSGPTPTPGNPTSVKRGGNGSTDNDNNAADFATGSPTPRNSATTPIIYGGPATQVRVETKADATGVVQPATNINSGISITNYAVARDANGLFAGNIFVAWLLVNVSGGVVAGDLVPAGDGKSATFTGHAPGSANINATWGPLTSVDSGLVTVESSAPPSGVGAANPSLVPAGQPTLLTVSVTPGNPPSPIVSVTGDLTAIGGVMGQSFYNDATHGDALAGDNIFSLSTIVATGTSSGLKTLPVTITDALSRPGSTTISLTVTNAPGIATQPQSRTNSAGDNAYFYVTATNGPQSYQWRLSGTNIPGATSSSYTRTNVGAADVGPYTVVVGNTYGSTTSAVAMLTVIGANSYKLAQWNFNNTTAPSVGSGTASLIGGTTASFAGGSTSNPSSSNAGWNTTTYPTQGTANKTAGAQFAVSTLGYVDVVVAWEEQHSSTASRYTRFQYTTDGLTYIDGPVSTITNASTFIYRTVDLSSIPGVADNTNFAFRIVSEHENTAITNTNPNYVATTSGSTYGPSGTIRFDGVTLFADPLPIQFVSQSAVKQTVGEGLPLNLSVTVSGGGPFTYQWYSNGVALVGATNSNLAFSAAALADTAKYRVMVGSPFTNNYPSDLFVVTVVEKNFFPTKLLPPPNGMYVNPYGRHVYCSANGVIISNIVHRLFGASVLPPEPGPPLSHNFGSVLEMEVSIDGGVNFQQVIATVNVGVGAQNAGSIGDEEEYATEMQGLTIISGPPNLQIRESPTLASSGRTDIKPIPGGYMINSFFDIYLEVSTDGGLTWCVGDRCLKRGLERAQQR